MKFGCFLSSSLLILLIQCLGLSIEFLILLKKIKNFQFLCLIIGQCLAGWLEQLVYESMCLLVFPTGAIIIGLKTQATLISIKKGFVGLNTPVIHRYSFNILHGGGGFCSPQNYTTRHDSLALCSNTFPGKLSSRTRRLCRRRVFLDGHCHDVQGCFNLGKQILRGNYLNYGFIILDASRNLTAAFAQTCIKVIQYSKNSEKACKKFATSRQEQTNTTSYNYQHRWKGRRFFLSKTKIKNQKSTTVLYRILLYSIKKCSRSLINFLKFSILQQGAFFNCLFPTEI